MKNTDDELHFALERREEPMSEISNIKDLEKQINDETGTMVSNKCDADNTDNNGFLDHVLSKIHQIDEKLRKIE